MAKAQRPQPRLRQPLLIAPTQPRGPAGTRESLVWLASFSRTALLTATWPPGAVRTCQVGQPCRISPRIRMQGRNARPVVRSALTGRLAGCGRERERRHSLVDGQGRGCPPNFLRRARDFCARRSSIHVSWRRHAERSTQSAEALATLYGAVLSSPFRQLLASGGGSWQRAIGVQRVCGQPGAEQLDDHAVTSKATRTVRARERTRPQRDTQAAARTTEKPRGRYRGGGHGSGYLAWFSARALSHASRLVAYS